MLIQSRHQIFFYFRIFSTYDLILMTLLPHGLTVTITTPCDSTFAPNFLVNFPKSLCAHKSRALAETSPEYPIASHGTVISVSLPPRFSNSTALLPSFNCFDQTSRSPSFHTRLPWRPSASWFTAITSLFVKISLISGVMLRKSFPAINGAASMHHKLKCARYSGVVIPPLPTSSMSGSFQCPGPAKLSKPTCKSTMFSIPSSQQVPSGHFFAPDHLSEISPVVRHKLPTSLAHSHGFAVPHSHMLKTIGRPVAFNASRMVEYASSAFRFPVLHQSYFK